ncbi:unnamed protein product [Closterium sp. Yama58-4]|nr:unnamed protein product [Closterium sp. Yama58-4]CAI5457410.1 unnamed protein product [Closterium sp. Yama58-4]
MARSPLASSLVAALLVTALFASCAQSRLVSNGLLGNRIPNRPAQVTITITSTVSDLKSTLQAQVNLLEGALTQSLNKLATALNDNASAATLALQAQIFALQSSIDSLNARIANLDLILYLRITRPGGVAPQATPVALQSRISSLKGSIPAINKRATSLNTDLAGILPNLRALLSQRVAALTQRVGALNLDVSALAAQVDALIAPLSDALGVADLVALLPHPAGMLRGVLTSCEGLLPVGAANIQITNMGSAYAVAYQLVATGMAEAPQAAAIYSGNSTCGQAAPPVALQLPGTWQLLSSVSWSLANVLTVAPADLAAVLSAIQAGINGQLFIGFTGSSSSLSGKLVGGRL